MPDQHASQLCTAGIRPQRCQDPRPSWLSDAIEPLLLSVQAEAGFLILLPGASARHPRKRWPHFASLSHALMDKGLNVITIPGPDEADIGADFAGTVLRPQGRCLTLPELSWIVRDARCTVGNDSGPLHLAACQDSPCVVLFDGSSPSLHRTGIHQRSNAQRLLARPLAALPVQTVLQAVLRSTATCSASAAAVTGGACAPTADGRLQHLATP